MKNITDNISSDHSFQVSLEGLIRNNSGLNERRSKMLDRVPCSEDWAKFDKDYIEVKDIAFLSAKTNHEFAILKGKNCDILFHGTHEHCRFSGLLYDMMEAGKLTLYAHSHPDVDFVIPSDDDRNLLKQINQKSSIIISWITGKQITFTASKFDI